MKEDDQKPLIKSTLFFLLKPVPFNVQSYQKQKGLGTHDQSLLRLRSYHLVKIQRLKWHFRNENKDIHCDIYKSKSKFNSLNKNAAL